MNTQPSSDYALAGFESVAKAMQTVTSVRGPAGPDAVETARRTYENQITEANTAFQQFFGDLLGQTAHAAPVEPEHPVKRNFFGFPVQD